MNKYFKNYTELSMEDRFAAIEWAKKTARDEVGADNGAAGGIEQMTADYTDWINRVIEPAYGTEDIDDESYNWWVKEDRSNDPRVIAFCESWADYQKDQQESDESEQPYGFAIAVYRTPHGKLYSRSFNPHLIEARHVESDELVWESAHVQVGDQFYLDESDAITALLDDCPDEFLDVASQANN